MTSWIRQVSRLLLVLAMALAVVGPVSAAREPQTPEEMYQLGVKLLDRGYYLRAVELFERVKTRYPFSQYATLSELRIGDSHFQKGEFQEAADSFQSFIKLHPKHPEMDYVIYKIAQAEFEQAPSLVERDQASTKRMLVAIQNFEERFPNSKYMEKVQKMRLEGRRRLALAVYDIGIFYYKRGRFVAVDEEKALALEAAMRRFDQVVDEYPDVKDVGAHALYYKGMSQAHLRRKKEATETLERLKSRFPDSGYMARLQRQVERIRGTPVPVPPSIENPVREPEPSLEKAAPEEGAAPEDGSRPGEESAPEPGGGPEEGSAPEGGSGPEEGSVPEGESAPGK